MSEKWFKITMPIKTWRGRQIGQLSPLWPERLLPVILRWMVNTGLMKRGRPQIDLFVAGWKEGFVEKHHGLRDWGWIDSKTQI